MHTIAMVPEFTMEVLAQLQVEDKELSDAYKLLHEGLDSSPDEIRKFPLGFRALLSLHLRSGWKVRC